MESLLLNDICVNLIGIYCFWSYVQLRNEILLISTIHYINQIEWPNTISIVWGPLTAEKVSSGVVTSSEVCLAITTWMLLWGFGKDYWHFFEILKGIMPQNLPEQILQRIVRLLADGNSQREVARMLGMPQGCISKILRRNRETGRLHYRKRGGLMKISTPQEDCKLLRMIRMNRFISAPRLRCRWSADLGGRCQFEPFGDGFWPPDIGLGVQPDVLGSLWSTGDAAVSGGGGTECGTSHNWDTVSSVMRPSSPYTTVTVGAKTRGEADWCLRPA